MPSTTRRKVVILGGGIASLSSAFELTAHPDWREDIESIDVYQMGWRLGGKGASGRNPQHGDRIEEHGLHVWPGFYENAFNLMRRCYAELGRPADAPLSKWTDAFKPHHFIVAAERIGAEWKHWPFEGLPNGALPGEMTDPPDIWEYLVGGLDLMVGWFHRVLEDDAPRLIPRVSRPRVAWLDSGLSAIERGFDLVGLGGWMDGLRDWRSGRLLRSALSGAVNVGREAMLDVARQLAQTGEPADSGTRRQELDLISWLADEAITWLTSRLGEFHELSDTVRRTWIQLDFGRTLLKGIARDRVLDRGFDMLDREDFVSWMRRHGASRMTLESALMRGLHDFVFAYENADPQRPNLAAGVAVRLLLRLTLTYKGAVMWKMQAGMGDVVFAPLYEVLRRRGVKFHFFHCVKDVVLSGDGRSISEIKLGRQASVAGGDYDPLIDVNGLPCWPHQPRYSQLVEGAALQAGQVDLESVWADWSDVGEQTLQAERDFDVGVLGIPLAALRHTCRQLIQANSRWRQMIDHVSTVKTQAAQLWLTSDLAGTGWPLKSPVLTGYEEPLETWADMSQTLAHENWPPASKPQSVAYFCCTVSDNGPAPDPGPNPFPQQETGHVHDAVHAALRRHVRPLFPAVCTPGTGAIDWSCLHDLNQGIGEARFDAQYWRSNSGPSDRYVQSLSGTTQYRLSPDQSGFSNLYLAGDWTLNELNVGCIEAAVISGRRAAAAVKRSI